MPGREARAASRAVGGSDGDGTSSCEARRLGAVVCDQQHFHGPGRGRWALALRRLEGCSHTDVDRAWCEGRSWWRGAEEVETEAALGEGGNACGEPVLVETVPGPLAWGGSRLAPGGVGGLGVFVLHPLCDSQADSSKHVFRLGSASLPRPFRVVVSCVDSVSGPVEG